MMEKIARFLGRLFGVPPRYAVDICTPTGWEGEDWYTLKAALEYYEQERQIVVQVPDGYDYQQVRVWDLWKEPEVVLAQNF